MAIPPVSADAPRATHDPRAGLRAQGMGGAAMAALVVGLGTWFALALAPVLGLGALIAGRGVDGEDAATGRALGGTALGFASVVLALGFLFGASVLYAALAGVR